MTPSQDKLKELCRCGLFTAIALTIFMIEARLPAPLPIPGAKLGLANAVTIYVAYTMGRVCATRVLVARILLGSFFAGQLSTLFYSGAGGLFCLALLCVMLPIFPPDKIWFVSPCCAVAHNLGQVCIACFMMGTSSILYFLPYLLLLSLVSGSFIGVVTQYLLKRLEKEKL